MKCMYLSGNKGFAVVYGIVILFVASIAGVSLITISQKDNISSIDQVKMRTASVSAEAALTAVEQQCENQPQVIIDITNKYIKLGSNTANKGWLLSNATNWERENRILLDSTISNPPQYSARILSFDPNSFILQVEGFGYGGGSGKKKAIGLYQLVGVSAMLPYSKFAIDIRGEALFFDRPINVTGNICFSDVLQFNSSAAGSVINGTFQAVSPTSQVLFGGSVTFQDRALFMGPTVFNAVVTFMKKAGFDTSPSVDRVVQAQEDLYFNNTINGNRSFDLNGHTAHRSDVWINPLRITDGSLVRDGATIDVGSALSLSTSLPPSLQFDISLIPASSIKRSSTVLGSQVDAVKINNLYTSSTGSLWNGYLVIRVDNTLEFKRLSGSNLVNYNTIWIVEGTITTHNGWYDCGTNTMTVIYLRSRGEAQSLGSAGYFRGFIYATDTTNVIYNWRIGNNFIGAVHHVSRAGRFQLNSGNTWNITWSDGVLDELISIGLVKIPGVGSTTNQLVLSDLKIKPRLLGKYF